MDGEKFECLKCKHVFIRKSGPLVHCPKCMHLYCKWLSWVDSKNSIHEHLKKK